MKPRTVSFADTMCCKNCRHFFQHYVRTDNDSFIRCNCGHCDCLRVKIVKINQVCDAFEARPEDKRDHAFPEESLVSLHSDML